MTRGVSTAVSRAARAVAVGVQQFLHYPVSWLLAYAGSLAVALPVAAMMAITLSGAADGYPAPLGRGALDVDWWQRLRQHEAGLATEFLPRTLGFAAPLDSISVLVGGPTWHAAPVVMALVVYAVTWAVLWAMVLTRLARTREAGARQAWHAARRFAGPMLSISVVAALVAGVLYLTLQPVLLDWLDVRLARGADSRAAFLIRTALAATFGAALLGVSVTADVARAHSVLAGEPSLVRNLGAAWRLVTRSAATVTLICMTWLALHLLLLAGYGVAEVIGGARLGGWRAVLVAQGYVAARLLLRLLWGSSLLAFTQHQRHAAPR